MRHPLLDPDVQVASSEHFTLEELRCKCGCGIVKVRSGSLTRLEDLRHRGGDKPIILSSAFRCPDYNARVSSTGRDGPHPTGRAFDIRCYGKRAYEIIDFAIIVGFTGIGISQRGPHSGRFIHVDDIESPMRPWVWSY